MANAVVTLDGSNPSYTNSSTGPNGGVIFGSFGSGEAGVYSDTAGVTFANTSSGDVDPGAGNPAGFGVDFLKSGTVTNEGYIGGGAATGADNAGVGVSMVGGTLTNDGTGGFHGIYGGISLGTGNGGIGVVMDGGTATNSSEIQGGKGFNGGSGGSGNGGDGVDLSGGASLTNKPGNGSQIFGGLGLHVGGIGVSASGTNTAVTNDGRITGGNGASTGNSNGGAGVQLSSGAYLLNSSTGTISGGNGNGTGIAGWGVTISTGATATNQGVSKYVHGTIEGVEVQGTLNNTGTITADSAATAGHPGSGFGIDLEGGTVNSTGGSIAGVYLDGGTLSTGNTYLNTGAPVAFGTQTGIWNINSGTHHGYYIPNTSTVTGFAVGDKINVTYLDVSTVKSDYSSSNHSVTLSNSVDDTLVFGGNFTNAHLAFNSYDGGTQITLEAGAACYRRGTRIRTSRGEVPIETLRVGDELLTRGGVARAVRWLGSRAIDCTRYKEPASVWPVHIQAGAFAEQVPSRDLWVSPGHALCVDGVLIQACKLVNGASIVQVAVDRVEYWHVELESHDVILAEGLASETYLDTGNRCAFINGGAFLEAFPDFEPKHWAQTCLPLVLEGEAIDHARAMLLERAQALGHTITDDGDLHVVADGERIEPLRLGERRLAFVLSRAPAQIELRCRTFIPAHVNAASHDPRSLGICLGRMQLDGQDVALDDARIFDAGWNALESNAEGHRWRWSQGLVALPAGTRLIVIDLHGRGFYWSRQQRLQAVACA